MEHRVVNLLGTAAKHLLTAMRRAFIAISITGLVVALLVAIITEVVSGLLSHSLPTGTTHLAAAALAVSFGYAAAITVAIVEMLKGMVTAIELIIDESEKLGSEVLRGGEAFVHASEDEVLRFGRAALGDAESLGRGAAGVAGGVIGGVAHEAHNLEHDVSSHMPGYHSPVPSTANVPGNGNSDSSGGSGY